MKDTRHPTGLGRRDAERARQVPLMRVLHEYGLFQRLLEHDFTARGLSPFSGGVFHADFNRNTWDDTAGRPLIDGELVAGDVVGLVQALEGVSYARALVILHERFVLGVRRETSAALRQPTGQPAELFEGLVADVPYLRRLGIPPEVAQAWGLGECMNGPMRGRIVFPIRRAEGTLVGYAGLDPTLGSSQECWSFTEGLRPELELLGIDRVHEDERVSKATIEHGLTLVNNPLEVVRMAQTMALPVVSPMSATLSRRQIELLLDPAINPTGRLVARGGVVECQGWLLALRRHHWRRCLEQPGRTSR